MHLLILQLYADSRLDLSHNLTDCISLRSDSYEPFSEDVPQSSAGPKAPSGGSVYSPTGSNDGSNNDGANAPVGNTSNLGPTIGAAVGGIVAPFVILAITIFVAKRVFSPTPTPHYVSPPHR
jgi:hypothetical protein